MDRLAPHQLGAGRRNPSVSSSRFSVAKGGVYSTDRFDSLTAFGIVDSVVLLYGNASNPSTSSGAI